MLSLQALAEQVNKVINFTDSRKFEKFLSSPQIFLHPDLIKILSDILASQIFTKEQKIIAASAFNFIFVKRINQNPVEWVNRCWDEYFSCMTHRSEDDFIDWLYIANTINALRYLISEQLFENIPVVFIQTYNQATFQGKLMLMRALNQQEQIQHRNQFIFIRQTFEDFLNEAHNVISNIHNLSSVSQDQIALEHETVTTIYEWVNILSCDQKFEKLKEESNCIFMFVTQQAMIDLIKDELKSLIHVKDGAICYRNSEKLIEFYDRSIIDTNDRTLEKMVSYQLSIKSSIISLLYFLAESFSNTSELKHFDTYAILSMTELLTPIFINELTENNLLKQDYLHQDHIFSSEFKQLLISIFTLLKKSAHFIFLLQVFTQTQQIILYQVFYDYLRTTDEEIQLYENDASQFVSMNEAFVQIEHDDLCDTPKQACGQFLKSFFELNNKAVVEYMEFLAACFRHQILNEDSDIISEVKKKGYKLPSIEMIYSTITLVYYNVGKTNQDFFQFIYEQFVAPQYILTLKKLEKARVLFFLNYCYHRYFLQNPSEGLKFIEWTGQTKQSSQTEFKIVMDLLAAAFQYGISEKVQMYLSYEIENTNKKDFFELILKIIQRYHMNIDIQNLLQITKNVSRRIQTQFNKNKQHFLDCKVTGDGDYSLISNCFNILEQLSENWEIIEREHRILQEVLDLVNFFNQEKVESFEFDGDVVRLLNNVLRQQKKVPIEFQMYLETMGSIVRGNRSFGPLLETYYLIFLKGSEAFKAQPSFLAKIQQSIEQNIFAQSVRTNQLVIEGLFLLCNILLVYPDLAKENRNLLTVTESILEEQKQELNKDSKLCASIFLYWMAGEYAFGGYHLEKLGECNIEIFKHEFGLMFALCITKLIEKYHNSESLQQLLKLAMKLLSYEHFYKNHKDYRKPQFTIPLFDTYLQMDSFGHIANSLQFLRNNLDKEIYVKHIEMLKQEIGGETLSQLLSTRMHNHTKQRNVLIVKKN